MPRSTESGKHVCFLEQQLIKPVASGLVFCVVALLIWIGTTHVDRARGELGVAVDGAGRPILGVSLADPDLAVAQMFSFPPSGAVLIQHIVADSPAHRVGLTEGDGIAAINGQRVGTTADVVRYLDRAKHGDLLSLTVVRGGFLHDVVLPLGGGRWR